MDHAQKLSRPAHSKLDTAIIVAVIGLVGTFVTATLKPVVDQWAAREFASHSPASAPLTGAAGGGQPTETAAPASPTDVPLTPFPTMTPDVSLNCISADEWTAHTTDTDLPAIVSDGCLDLAEWGISRADGVISILRYQTRRGEWYGISLPIPRDVVIEFNLAVKHVQNGELWFGTSEGASPTAKGVYLVRKENGLFDVRSCASDSCRTEFGDISIPDDHGNYVIRLELAGNRLDININDGLFYRRDFQVSFSNRRFYLGLRPFSSAYLNAELFGLDIQEK
ncbi:MAG: hypothetical protein FD146_1742 [Anaerolineaceae bacterium]|nr:MAG: hypothetical protein FD146_1742 [Anaerolineaceae bacterium]